MFSVCLWRQSCQYFRSCPNLSDGAPTVNCHCRKIPLHLQNITQKTCKRSLSLLLIYMLKPKVKSHNKPQWPTRLELNPVSVASTNNEYRYFPLDGMLVHRRVTPSSIVYRRYPFIHLDEERQCGVKFRV